MGMFSLTEACDYELTLLCSNGQVWYALITFLYVDILGKSFFRITKWKII